VEREGGRRGKRDWRIHWPREEEVGLLLTMIPHIRI